MPSPFPGMDPFIEHQEWTDFHAKLITAISDHLTPAIAPKYVTRVERRVYLEHLHSDNGGDFIHDVAVLSQSEETGPRTQAAVATGIAPVECVLPMPQEQRESFLLIRMRETMEVVTVLEVLSPSNKRRGSDGREEYLSKRESVLESRSHLVELDLLRGGERLPILTTPPAGDFYAIISRRPRRPRAQVYAWSVRQKLPPIPIPLKDNDLDVTLDLQAVFATVYDRARYDLTIDYSQELRPPLGDLDAEWANGLLASRS